MLKRSGQPGGSVVPLEPRKSSFPWVEMARAPLVAPRITTAGTMMKTELMMMMTSQMITREELSLPHDWRALGRGLLRNLVWEGGRKGTWGEEVLHQNVRMWDVLFCMCVCNLGGSDGSLSGSDGEEQELWEETQIGKGVKRRPGEQVGRDWGSLFTPYFLKFYFFYKFSLSFWCDFILSHSFGQFKPSISITTPHCTAALTSFILLFSSPQSPSGSESSSYSNSSSNSRRDRQRQKKRSAGVRIPKTLPPISVSMVKKRITGKYVSSGRHLTCTVM